jgi:murein L,D-transpeptidase YafK
LLVKVAGSRFDRQPDDMRKHRSVRTDEATPESTKRAAQRKRRLRRTILLGLFVAITASLVIGNWDLITGALETRAIAAKRSSYWAVWALGRPLPGTPDLNALDQRLEAGGFTLEQPILIRIYKREFELEVWKAKDGRYHHFATYPICRWSGRLGPKLKEGDRQSPEGFYTVGKSQLNPNSRWRRSFNLGFPNLYDRAHARTGSFLMVHGGCGSVGCYAMTDPVIDEIWKIVTSALDAGQRRFQVQAFPFRMTQENLSTKTADLLYPFWRTLKAGADQFDQTGLPPRVRVCKGEYVFLPGSDVHSANQPPIASCNGVSARHPGPET